MSKFSILLFVAFACKLWYHSGLHPILVPRSRAFVVLALVLGLFVTVVWAQPTQSPIGTPGATTHSLEFGGRTRTYLLHLPPAIATRNPLPLVILLHGGGGNGPGAARMSNMSAKADREGFAVVYPNGTGILPNILLTWNAGNCCAYALNNNVDDVGFLRALVERLTTTLPIDRKRVFITGMSNGGMMSYRAACELAETIAAMAPVAGAQNLETCRPSEAVSLVVFHGTEDQYVLYEGGQTRSAIGGGRVDRPVSYAVSFWARHNACTGTPERLERGNVLRETHRGCRDGTQVALYAIKGAGHAWPGGTPGLSFGGRVGDEPTNDISATDVIWEFFASHPKRR